MENQIKIFLNAFLYENLGDDLFVQILSHRYPDVEFYIMAENKYNGYFNKNVIYAMNNYDIKRVRIDNKILRMFYLLHLPSKVLFPGFLRYYNRKKYKLCQMCDYNVYVIGSGFIEPKEYSFFDYIADYRYYKNSVHLLSCNFGPYRSKRYLNRHIKLFELADEIWFRDTFSYNLFSKLDNIHNAMDMVFSYNLGECFFLPQNYGKYILISVVSFQKDGNYDSVIQKKYNDFIVRIIKHIMKTSNSKIILIAFCQKQGDSEVINDILGELQYKERIESYSYPDISDKQIMGLFKNAEAIIASRYHAMIIGLLYRIKTYIISYSSKINNVINDIDSNIPYIDSTELDSMKEDYFIDNYGYIISESKLSYLKASAEKQFQELDRLLQGNAE